MSSDVRQTANPCESLLTVSSTEKNDRALETGTFLWISIESSSIMQGVPNASGLRCLSFGCGYPYITRERIQIQGEQTPQMITSASQQNVLHSAGFFWKRLSPSKQKINKTPAITLVDSFYSAQSILSATTSISSIWDANIQITFG